MNKARAVSRFGLEVWRKSAAELGRVPSAAELAALPEDVARGGSFTGGIDVVDGWPADKPWVTSGSSIPGLYPPGALLLVPPGAWLAAPATVVRPRGPEGVRAARVLMLGYLGVGLMGDAVQLARSASCSFSRPWACATP